MHGNHILDISKCHCDLKNKVKVTKINTSPPPNNVPSSQQCIYTSTKNILNGVLMSKTDEIGEKVSMGKGMG